MKLRRFKLICIDAVCGWVGYRMEENMCQAIKGRCPECDGAVVASKP